MGKWSSANVIGLSVGAAIAVSTMAVAQQRPPEEKQPRVVPQYAPVANDQFRAPAPHQPTRFVVTPIAAGLTWPLAIEEMPDGQMLVSDRAGTIRVVSPAGVVSAPIAGVPAVQPEVRGGVLDVALSPDFARSRRIFFCYAEPVGDESRLAVASAVLAADARSLLDMRVIWRMERTSPSQEHYGARLSFDRQGMLMFATGERSPDGGKLGRDAVLAARNDAQDWTSSLGKVIRITPTGGIPADNPPPHGPGGRPDVYAAGFRNPLGNAIDPATGDFWTVEHGPKSGDELNHIRPGGNYGWPVVSYGIEYHGEPVGKGISALAGTEQPVYFWDPNIAPGAMLFYRGSRFRGWRGDIIVAGEKSQRLSRLTMRNGRVVTEEWLPMGTRTRDVIEARDGSLLVLTDEMAGRILRISPQR